MKNIIVILVGIIIGSGSTLLIQQAKSPSNTTILNEIDGVDFGGMKATDLSTDNLHIIDIEGQFLTISPKNNPNIYVFFHLQDDGFFDISLKDNSGASASFNDKDSDGIWDYRDFNNNDVLYAYGTGSGYPDTVLENDKKSLTRIDGIYYEIHGIPGNPYIIRAGDNIEIQPDPNGRGFFTIK